MKKKLILFSIISVVLLLSVPSIPAANYNMVLEENRSQFLDEIQNMEINDIKDMLAGWDKTELRESYSSNILELKQQLTDYIGPYVDIELIIIILLQLTAMAIQGSPSLTGLITVAICSAIVASELISGEEMPKTNQIHTVFVQSFFAVLIALESRIMRHKIPQALVVFITTMLSSILVSILFGAEAT